MSDSFKITVLEVLEAAWGFRVKAKECVHMCVGLRGKMCLRVTEWTFCCVFTFGFFNLLLGYFPLLSSVLPMNLFMPPAQNPCRLCVHRRSRSSRQSDLRG